MTLKLRILSLKSDITICIIDIEENYRKSYYVNHFELRKLTEYSIEEGGLKSQNRCKYSTNACLKAVENSVENVE